MHPQTGLNLSELLSAEHRRAIANHKANIAGSQLPNYLTLAPEAGGPAPGPADPHHLMGLQPDAEGLPLLPRVTLEDLAPAVWGIEEHMRQVADRVRKHAPGDWHAIDRVILSAAPSPDGYQLIGNPVYVAGRAPTRRLTVYNPNAFPVDVTDAAGAGALLTIPSGTSIVMPWNADSVIVTTAAANVAVANALVTLVRSDRETDEIRAYPIGGTGAGLLLNETTGASEQARTPSIFKIAGAVTGGGNTALWAPATGKRFRLMGVSISYGADITAAAAGDLVIGVLDQGTPIYRFRLYTPTAVPAGASGGNVLTWAPGENGYPSAAVGNVLNLNMTSALTGGSALDMMAWGTEE